MKTIDIKDLFKPKQAPPPKEGFRLEEEGDKISAVSVSRTIRTIDDLLSFAKIDRSIWEVERVTVNSWDMGYKDACKHAHTKELYQIKAVLRRKAPQVTAMETLVGLMRSRAPLLKVPPVRKLKLPHRRSLEIDVMDPHFGLLCRPPEADAPWDMEIAAGMYLQAIDDLVEKTRPYGPFEEVFAPFGNDFVHSDDVFHRTTAGTTQPESIAWHHVYVEAKKIAIEMVMKLRKVAKKVHLYQIPGNHSRVSDFTMAQVLEAWFHRDPAVVVHADSSPYKFHRYGVNLIGFEHGHSVSSIRLAALMANECRDIWHQTEYREWHLGDQHRKGSSKPAAFEEQGVSVEYIPGLTAPNEWHRLKAFSHQKRGAMAFVYDFHTGPIARCQFNISQYTHKALSKN